MLEFDIDYLLHATIELKKNLYSRKIIKNKNYYFLFGDVHHLDFNLLMKKIFLDEYVYVYSSGKLKIKKREEIISQEVLDSYLYSIERKNTGKFIIFSKNMGIILVMEDIHDDIFLLCVKNKSIVDMINTEFKGESIEDVWISDIEDTSLKNRFVKAQYLSKHVLKRMEFNYKNKRCNIF